MCNFFTSSSVLSLAVLLLDDFFHHLRRRFVVSFTHTDAKKHVYNFFIMFANLWFAMFIYLPCAPVSIIVKKSFSRIYKKRLTTKVYWFYTIEKAFPSPDIFNLRYLQCFRVDIFLKPLLSSPVLRFSFRRPFSFFERRVVSSDRCIYQW